VKRREERKSLTAIFSLGEALSVYLLTAVAGEREKSLLKAEPPKVLNSWLAPASAALRTFSDMSDDTSVTDQSVWIER
jgi:hypothetical protein